MTLVFRAARLPLLPGAARLAVGGYLTGGCGRNRCYLAGKIAIGRSVAADLAEVAFDPQTSGGLLIALPKADGTARNVFHMQPVLNGCKVWGNSAPCATLGMEVTQETEERLEESP